jgi:hypothetical protein
MRTWEGTGGVGTAVTGGVLSVAEVWVIDEMLKESLEGVG